MHVVLPVCVAAAEGREDGAHGQSARSLLVRDDHGGYHDLVYHLAPRVKGKCAYSVLLGFQCHAGCSHNYLKPLIHDLGSSDRFHFQKESLGQTFSLC